MKKKGIGLNVKKPSKACSDKNCPFHSNLSVRGRTFTGLVTSDKMTKTATIVWSRRTYVPKYERYEKKRSKVKAHNPDCLGAKKGDVVRIAETKPISKTKNFVVIEILGKESKKEALKEEALLEAEGEDKSKSKAATAKQEQQKKTPREEK